MAAGEGQEHGLLSLVESINKALECVICLEEQKDLRTLTCCEKLICFQCLEKLFDKEENNRRHEETPSCPLCAKPLTKKADKYKVNRLAHHFQIYAQSLKKAVQKDEKDCETDRCERPYDKLCKNCKKFLCYRCSDDLCTAADNVHEATDIRDCVAHSRESFNLWRTSKEKYIQGLHKKREATCTQMRSYGQQLVDGSSDTLVDVAEDIVPLLTVASEELKEVHGELAGEESTLKFLVDAVEKVGDKELIHLMNQLDLYEEKREIILGDYEAFVSNIQCWHVCGDNSGHILIGQTGALDVVDAESKQTLKTLKFEKYVFTVESYKDMIILGVSVSNLKSMVVTLDQEYNETNRWSVPSSTIDLTAVDDKIFLSVSDSNIHAYSLAGERLIRSDIIWNGSVVAVTSVQPCSLIFDDRNEHKVYKQCVTSGRRELNWCISVRAPNCLCVDNSGLIWVRSNINDCLTVLNRDGTKHQEDIMDEKFTRLGRVDGILVHGSYLYLAHESGLGRFPITYQ